MWVVINDTHIYQKGKEVMIKNP